MAKTAMYPIKDSLRFCSMAAFALICLTAQAATIQVVSEDSSYSYLENGKVAGGGSAVVEASLKLAGLPDYQITIYPWARSYDIALQQPNVLIYPIIRSPDRENMFKWAGELERINQEFYTLRSHPELVINNLADAMKYTVGVVRDDSRQQYLEHQGFTRLVVSANNLDNLRKLINGQVEMIPMPEREARRQCNELGIPFDNLRSVYQVEELSRSVYIAFSITTADETVAQFSKAFNALKKEGTVDRLLER